MPSLPIRWVLGRAYVQATEEEARVVAALDAALTGGETTRDALTGQFGNPVVVVTRRLEAAGDIRATWSRWARAKLPEALRPETDARIDDDGVLHFRLDKQAACAGRLELRREADALDIQVKLKAYPAKPEEIRRVAESLLKEAV